MRPAASTMRLKMCGSNIVTILSMKKNVLFLAMPTFILLGPALVYRQIVMVSESNFSNHKPNSFTVAMSASP